MGENERKSFRTLLIMLVAYVAVFAFGTGKLILSISELGWHPAFFVAIATGVVGLFFLWRFLQSVIGYRRKFR